MFSSTSKLKERFQKSCTAGHMKDIETGAVHFFLNFDKIIRNKKLAIFQHSLKDLDLLVISINKNWCLILYKTKTSKIQTGPISCVLRPDTKTSHVCAA